MKTVVKVALAGVFALVVASARAEDKAAAPAAQPEAPRGAEMKLDDLAKRAGERLRMLEQEAVRMEEELARAKDNPELAAMIAAAQNNQAALIDNLKAQVAALTAGDKAGIQILLAEFKDLQADVFKARSAIMLSHRAAETRNLAQHVPPAAGAAGAARQKYVEALTALGDFYAQQAKHPPASVEGRQMPSEFLAAEGGLRAASDCARIEFEYQAGLEQVKTLTAQNPEAPAIQAAGAALVEKATALRDAQLKMAEAQDAVQKALVARRQAEEALQKARNESLTDRKGRNEQKPGASAKP